jgi:membrane fusion protein (multidrug efflux system)
VKRRSPIALVLFPLLIGCASTPAPTEVAATPQSKLPQVSVKTVSQEPLERTVEVVGTILAEERVTVSNEVPGTVASIEADFGDIVEAGHVLMQLDPRELDLQLGVARAGVAQAQARLVKARASAARARTLYPEEAISKERLDSVEAELGIAEADAEAARRQAALADKRRSDATIRAPFRAAIQARMVALGQHVAPFTPLFELVAIGKLKFRGEVPERFAPGIRAGLPLALTVESQQETAISATITRVASALTQSSRTLPFESEFEDATGKLAPGSFARVRIRLAPSPAVLAPREAVIQFAGVDRAFVVRDGKVEARTLRLGEQFGQQVEVIDGLESGEQVVTAGQDRLENGLAVQVLEKPS